MSSLEYSQGPNHEVKVWDRFIRNRDKIEHRFTDFPKDELKVFEDAIIKQEPYWKSKELYKQLVATSLSQNYRPDCWTSQWPVRSRCKPHLRSPSIVLDLPNINQYVYGCNVVDWSSTSYLTVAFPRTVHLWHSLTNRTLKIENQGTCCLRWSDDGSALFIASKNRTFKYLDMNVNEDLTTMNVPSCHLSCYISCSAFHPKSPIMYMGCCLGSVTAYHVNKGLHIISKFVEMTPGEGIINLRSSIDGKYLAVTSMANEIVICDTTKFTCLFSIGMSAPSRAVAWHPWKKNLLVVADCNGYMALYNVLNPDDALATYVSTVDSAIMNVTFNPISAELVVSQTIFPDGTGDYIRNQDLRQSRSQLSVLASFDRVVDVIEGHEGSVQFLNWNPDGTQLATAGSDETARIWDFLPQPLKQRTKKKSSALNYVSASLEIGNRMGLAIR